MALDSNSPGDERSAGSGSERFGAAGLKLVGDRGAATGAAGAAPGQAAGAFGDSRSVDAKLGDAAGSDAKGIEGGRPAPVRRGGRKQGRQLPLWLFVTLLVLFLFGYGYQAHQASQFEAEVAQLEASLARAESRLESHRTHLLEIRGGVHDLSSRLESLRVLIDRDPTAPVESSAAADPAAPIPPAHPTQP